MNACYIALWCLNNSDESRRSLGMKWSGIGYVEVCLKGDFKGCFTSDKHFVVDLEFLNYYFYSKYISLLLCFK